jgi:hypothetical protein
MDAVNELDRRYVTQVETVKAAIGAIEEASHTAVEIAETSQGGRRSAEVQQAAGRIRQIIRDLGRYIIALGGDREEEHATLLAALRQQEQHLGRIVELLESGR